jgi:hypothetical protein
LNKHLKSIVNKFLTVSRVHLEKYLRKFA